MAVQFDREDLLHAMQSRDAEIIVLKHDVERLTAENERLRKLLDAVANQGWQEIDDDLRRQIRAYQQTTPQKEKLPHFREMRGIFKEEGK